MIVALTGTIYAQTGPFDPEKLPPTIDASRQVHFTSIDRAFERPNANWLPCLKTLTGGDHTTAEVTIVGGHTGLSVSGIKFNNVDTNWMFWADKHSIDILMQVYGDDAFLDKAGRMQYFNFLTGTLPEPIAVDGGALSKDIINQPNGTGCCSASRMACGTWTAGRLVGTIHPKAKDDPKHRRAASRGTAARTAERSGWTGCTS